MTALSLSEAPAATAMAKITIASALKARWHAATHKQNGSYEIDTVAPASPERRVRSLLPWRGGGGAAPTPPSSQATAGLGRAATGGPQDRARRHAGAARRLADDGTGAHPAGARIGHVTMAVAALGRMMAAAQFR